MVPKLRFSEFIKGWQQKKIGDVFTIFSGFAFKSTDATTSGCRWLKIADVGCQVMTPGTPSFLPNHFSNEYHKFLIRKDDYVIALTRPILNGKLKISVAGKEYDGSLLNQRVGKIVTINNPKFVYSLLQMESTVSKINNCIAGTDPPNLSTQDIKDMIVYVPIIEEQIKIADFMSSVDEKIALLNKQYDLLCQYKKGMMQKIFSQEVRFKEDDGSAFPDWENQKLGDVAVFLKGKGVAKTDVLENGERECIRYGELYTDYGEVISKIKSRTNQPLNDSILSISRDVLIPSSGETAIDISKASCVLSDGVILGGDLNIIRSKVIDGIFLSYYINSQKKYEIAQMAQGNSVVHLYAKQLAKTEIYYPCKKEQIKIANFVSALDDKITTKKAELDKLKSWKHGLLQQMFV
ncbi:restriction endonuclease subunit S [Pantoea sp. SORGH_AS_0659]|uniref:restriction endonuclease subunit S n=1 Tax=Pantoea sp. SORGH_AS_0659 TaxID=3062597 RepID=UPI00286C7214|nr:restriction endonuclease subunit S [Pantoea sp. SORGH_AS_0659]